LVVDWTHFTPSTVFNRALRTLQSGYSRADYLSKISLLQVIDSGVHLLTSSLTVPIKLDLILHKSIFAFSSIFNKASAINYLSDPASAVRLRFHRRVPAAPPFFLFLPSFAEES
jgi:hypothetical protein